MHRKSLAFLLMFAFVVSVISGCGGSYTSEIAEQYPDGATKKINHYKEKDSGRELYKIEEYHNNGIKRIEGYFKDGDRHGKWSSWHESGQLWSVANYKEGQLHGKQTVYYPSGKKFYEGTFENGIRTGLWQFWNEAGALVKSKTY